MSRFSTLGGAAVCLLSGWMLVALSTSAQPVPSDSVRLSLAHSSPPAPADSADVLRLPDLLRDAAAANPSLRAARLQAEARAREGPQASALPDPVVGVTAFPVPVVTARGAQRTQWRVQQSFPFPGTRSLRGRVADREAEAARADADALAQDVALRIRKAYYTLYRTGEHARLIRRFQSDLAQFEDAALAQYEVGTEGQPAVLKAQIERQRLDVRLESVAADRRSALQVLARLTGRPSLARTARRVAVDLDADPGDAGTKSPAGNAGPPDSTVSADTTAPRLTRALARRPEAQALRARIDRSEQQEALARRDRLPDVTVGAQYFDIAERGRAPTTTGRDAFAVSLGVTVPLWQGKYDAQIEQARANRRRAEADLSAFELDVRTRLADHRHRLERQRRQLRLLDATLLPKAETALEATLSGYRAGRSDFLDLLDAQRTLFQLQVDRVDVFTQLLKTRADLDRIAGALALPTDR